MNDTTDSKTNHRSSKSALSSLVMRGCTGTHGGSKNMCASCANNIKNYPETPEGKLAWSMVEKIDEMTCRIPIKGRYWTQYINRLELERNRAGLSLQKAANQIGCTKPHLHDMEKGRSMNPTASILNGIRRAYGMTAEEVLGLYA